MGIMWRKTNASKRGGKKPSTTLTMAKKNCGPLKWVKVRSAKSSDLSLIPETNRWKEIIDCRKLSADLHTCATTRPPRPIKFFFSLSDWAAKWMKLSKAVYLSSVLYGYSWSDFPLSTVEGHLFLSANASPDFSVWSLIQRESSLHEEGALGSSCPA